MASRSLNKRKILYADKESVIKQWSKLHAYRRAPPFGARCAILKSGIPLVLQEQVLHASTWSVASNADNYGASSSERTQTSLLENTRTHCIAHSNSQPTLGLNLLCCHLLWLHPSTPADQQGSWSGRCPESLNTNANRQSRYPFNPRMNAAGWVPSY